MYSCIYFPMKNKMLILHDRASRSMSQQCTRVCFQKKSDDRFLVAKLASPSLMFLTKQSVFAMISLSEFLNHTFLNWTTGKVVHTMWLWHVSVNLSEAVVFRSTYFRESFREHWVMSFGSHLGCLSVGILPCLLRLIFKQFCDGSGAISGAPLVSSLVGS